MPGSKFYNTVKVKQQTVDFFFKLRLATVCDANYHPQPIVSRPSLTIDPPMSVLSPGKSRNNINFK